MYRILLDDVSNSRFQYDWFSFVKSILDSTGLSYIWLEQNTENSFWLSQTVKITLESQFKQEWQTSIDTSSKCINYRLFKTEHKFENYLLNLPPKLMKTFIKFRLCNNKLPIEVGRWRGIDRNRRKCTLCNLNLIGDEFHYVIQCPFFENDRKLICPRITRRNQNCITFSNIFNETSSVKLIKLCTFLGKILAVFM